RGFAGAAADVAVLLTERGLGGGDADLEVRHRRWRGDRSPRAVAARRMAKRWAHITPSPLRGGGSTHAKHERGEGPTQARPLSLPPLRGSLPPPQRGEGLGKALALAFPDRVSRRRDSSGERWQSVGGRGFRLDPATPLARSEWLAVGEVAGHASGARILSAAPLDERELLDLFGDRIEIRHDGAFDPATGSVTPTRSRRLGAIRLSSGPDPAPDPAAIEQALLKGVREHGLELLPWDEPAVELRQRAAFAHRFDPGIAPLDDEMLLARADEWLAPLLAGKRRLADVSGLAAALRQLLGYSAGQTLDRLAPADFESPAGSRHSIDYSAEAGPTVEVRAQALFGLSLHPAIANGAVPLTLVITSPAGRPIQTTRDLPGFWAGSWRDVAKDMRGRYPKHPWPDDPASAAPTLRTKRAS
ncbi:MAG TPA: ATP-dependent helicase C-terminal domain-containing protein, partial [Sphingomicrobium sp.]|nr:ATP-dependent helicase C-terminal domain-containing protein [Sphingomicrobium sp.]